VRSGLRTVPNYTCILGSTVFDECNLQRGICTSTLCAHCEPQSCPDSEMWSTASRWFSASCSGKQENGEQFVGDAPGRRSTAGSARSRRSPERGGRAASIHGRAACRRAGELLLLGGSASSKLTKAAATGRAAGAAAHRPLSAWRWGTMGAR
jgi:hypothetical protein